MPKHLRWTQVSVIVLTLLLPLTLVLAQGGSDVPWWTVDGGGETGSGGPFTLSGTIGQPDAGGVQGGAYRLMGGFWGPFGAPQMPSTLYLPLVIRSR